MIDALNPAMADALRLTRAGDLTEAMRRIRETLAPRTPAAHPASSAPAGDVLDLKPARVTSRARGRQPEPPARQPRTGDFAQRIHRCATGTMRYHLHTPLNAMPGMALVVMLHGCTQSPEDFARGTGMSRLADELGFLVAYPAQEQAANAQKCWNWFKPGDQRRGAGEPARIAGVTREVIAAEGVDPARVYVAGLSAGGAAAAIMASAYPDIYAAAGIHSGLACGAARDLPGALGAMRRGGGASVAGRSDGFVPTITFHGDGDKTVDAVNSREIIAAAGAAAGVRLETRTERGRAAGRDYTREVSIDPAGKARLEHWTIHGGGHAWSGGDPSGSYADASGPDASREMLRFFLTHRLAAGR